MELDDLKTRFNARLEEESLLRSPTELGLSIRKNAASVTGKIKRNICYELAACVLCIFIALLIWKKYSFEYIHLFCIAAILFAAVFCGYLYALYRKIIFFETSTDNTRYRLQQTILIVSRFTRLDFRVTMGLVPVIFIFGLITGYLDVSKQGLLQQFHWSNQMLLYTITFIISWPALVYVFSRWHIRKMYGKYLIQLQQQLKDIENG